MGSGKVRVLKRVAQHQSGHNGQLIHALGPGSVVVKNIGPVVHVGGGKCHFNALIFSDLPILLGRQIQTVVGGQTLAVQVTIQDAHLAILRGIGVIHVGLTKSVRKGLLLVVAPNRRKGEARTIVPPDIDKLCRSTLDGVSQGLNGKVGDGLVWGDDSLVVELIARKFYADDREPGATITISAL